MGSNMGKEPEFQLDLDEFDTTPEPEKDASNTQQSESTKKLQIPRFFTTADVHPYDEIDWEYRTASITNDKGEVLFERENVEVHILIVTDGSMGYCNESEKDTMSNIRQKETSKCYQYLGIPKENIIRLGFPSGQINNYLGRTQAKPII